MGAGCFFFEGVRRLGALAALGIACRCAAADTPWQAALSFDYDAATRGFERAAKAQPNDARLAVAYAASLLVKQPLTTGNVEDAHALLEKIAARTDAGDNAVIALYLLARIEQDHVTPARLSEARTHYRAVIDGHPEHVLAGQAAVQLALLDAWGDPKKDINVAVTEVEALLAATRRPEAQRELHFILARLQFEGRHDMAAAITHLEAGRALNYQKPFRNAEVDLMIADMARQSGKPELALSHYQAFLLANARDSRASTVRGYVKELQGRTDATAVAVKP